VRPYAVFLNDTWIACTVDPLTATAAAATTTTSKTTEGDSKFQFPTTGDYTTSTVTIASRVVSSVTRSAGNIGNSVCSCKMMIFLSMFSNVELCYTLPEITGRVYRLKHE